MEKKYDPYTKEDKKVVGYPGGGETDEDAALSISQQCAKKAAKFALKDSYVDHERHRLTTPYGGNQDDHDDDDIICADSDSSIPAPTSFVRQNPLPTTRIQQRPFTTQKREMTTTTTSLSTDSSHLDQVQPGAMAISGIQNGNHHRRCNNNNAAAVADSMSQSFYEAEDSIRTTVPLFHSSLKNDSTKENDLSSLPMATPIQAHLVQDEMETVLELQETKEQLQKHTQEMSALKAKLQQMETMQNEIQIMKQKLQTTVPAVKVTPDIVGKKNHYSKQEKNALSVLLADNNTNKNNTTTVTTTNNSLSELGHHQEDEKTSCCIIL